MLSTDYIYIIRSILAAKTNRNTFIETHHFKADQFKRFRHRTNELLLAPVSKTTTTATRKWYLWLRTIYIDAYYTRVIFGKKRKFIACTRNMKNVYNIHSFRTSFIGTGVWCIIWEEKSMNYPTRGNRKNDNSASLLSVRI